MTEPAPVAPVVTAQAKAAGQDDKAGAPAAPAELPAIKPKAAEPSQALVAARQAKAEADAALAAAEAGTPPAPKPEAAKADPGPKLDADGKPLPTEPNKDPNWQAQFATFEDPSAQAAVDLMKEAGVSPVEANAYFKKGIETGKIEDIDWAGLELKIGKTKTQLVKNGVTQYYNDTYKVQQQTVQDVHTVFGGEDGWTTVRDWAHAAEKTDPAVKKQVDAVRKMIDQGGEIAKTGAEKLKRMYDADPKTTGLGTKKVLQGDGIPSAVEGGPLSKADYFTQNKAAQAKGDQALIASLRARRAAGIQQGI